MNRAGHERLNVFLVTRAAWERLEFLIKHVDDSRSSPFLSSILNLCASGTAKLCNGASSFGYGVEFTSRKPRVQ